MINTEPIYDFVAVLKFFILMQAATTQPSFINM